LQIDGPYAENALKKSGIDPQRRAETLTVPEFIILSNQLIH
jgi:hypothetical protein